MINQLRRKITSKKLANGGISTLPVPYQAAPFFSKQGLRRAAHTAGQQFNRLPGFIKKPLKIFNPITKNPYSLAMWYGIPALTYAGKKYDDWKNMKETSLEELGIRPFSDAAGVSQPVSEETQVAETEQVVPNIEQGQLPADMIKVYEQVSAYAMENNIPYEEAYAILVKGQQPVKKGLSLEAAFPGMSNSEIINLRNKTEADSGIKIAPNAQKEVVDDALKNDQMEGLNIEPTNDPEKSNAAGVAADDTTIIMSDAQINQEYKNRANQEKEADRLVEYDMMGEFAKNNRSEYAIQLDKLVSDIVGPESKKSKNLLLLQLAANLMTNRTDQPGFKGFVDVLGQAGQQVIPMALALETQRRDDELELKKAVMANQNAKDKLDEWSPKNKIVKFRMPKWDESGEIIGWEDEVMTTIARTSKNGSVEATITDTDGSNLRTLDITNFKYRMLDSPDSATIAKYNDKINQKVNALKGTQEALSIITERPELIGSKGTVTEVGQKAWDIAKSWWGDQPFEDYFDKWSQTKVQFMNNQKIARDEAAALNSDGRLTKDEEEFFDKEMKDGLEWIASSRAELAASMADSNDLQIKAKLRTIELLTSYALANLLKNEDRLAVQDIKRAEKATKLFGPLTSPTQSIAKYLTLESNLKAAIQNDIKQAKVVGILPEDIVAYSEGLNLTKTGDAKDEKFRKNLQSILEQELDTPDLFNSMTHELFKDFAEAVIGEDE